MRRRWVKTLAAFAVAAAASAPASAGSPYIDGARQGQTGQPSPPGGGAMPIRRGPAGLFRCSFREQRTKLERKNCGTITN